MIHTRAERLRNGRPAPRGAVALKLARSSTDDRQIQLEDPIQSPEPTLTHFDAAAAHGLDPFKSDVRLWMEKTGRQDLLQPGRPQDDSAAYWGRLLEPIVAAHYTHRTGLQVRRADARLCHPRYAWMTATVKREVMGSPHVQLLECLCVGMEAAGLWAKGVPEHIRLRVVHLLAVTGHRAADLIVLLGGQDLQLHRIERDKGEIARLIRAERAFWRGVEQDLAPAARGEN